MHLLPSLQNELRLRHFVFLRSGVRDYGKKIDEAQMMLMCCVIYS